MMQVVISVGLSVLALAALIVASALLVAFVQNRFTSRSALNDLPGPFLARFTNWWRLCMAWRGHINTDTLAIHKHYGDVVRVGPNCVSLADVDMIKQIFSAKGVRKSDMYCGASFVQDRKTIDTIFSTRDEAAHTFMFKPIARLYTMSNIVTHEDLVDSALDSFIGQLDRRFVETGDICKMHDWVSFFTWDTIGILTFSEDFGFMSQGEDVMGLINTNDRIMDYFSLTTQMPILDRFLAKNPIVAIGPPSATAAAVFSAQRMFERLSKATDTDESKQRDMLDSFIAIKQVNPELPDSLIISYIMMNILAGSDTTTCALRAAIYYVLKDERIHAKLKNELDIAKIQMPISWKHTQSLPYLTAVVREALRIHPSVAESLERVLPEGLQLSDGRYLPPGTVVGMNAWVTSRDKVFGDHTDQFVPERWLKSPTESETDFQHRLTAMNAADLTFGYGKRACYGKPIALLEIFKAIATLFLTYNMRLVDAKNGWSTKANFFAHQSNIDVYISRR